MIPRRQCSGAQAYRRSCGIQTFLGRTVRRVVQESGWVGERRVASEAAGEPSRGRHTSENAGMSSERRVRNPSAE